MRTPAYVLSFPIVAACLAARPAVAQEPQHQMRQERPPARLESVAVAEAPAIDGQPSDAIWNYARALQVAADKVWPKPEPHRTAVVLKSAHTKTHIYFLVRWKDESKDDASHKPWVWNASSGAYAEGPEREDMFTLAFQHTGAFTADMLSGEPGVWDVWQWKATRTNPQGYAMDRTHRYTPEKPEGKARSYTARDGRTIWITRPEDAGDTVEKKQPAPEERASDRVPQYLPGTPSGSAADVRAKGVWADGWWTLELERKLDTGHADDTAFDTELVYRMAVAAHDRTGDMDKASGAIELAFVPSLPTAEIARITGVEGMLKDGEYKISVAQSDLDVKVDGFPIIPPMGTTSWVAFMPIGREAMIMGDLVLLEDEFRPVQSALIERGLTITAIHNHFLRDTPKVMFMHVGGHGEPLALAGSVRAVLDKVAELRRAKGLAAQARSVPSTLDGVALSRILGHPGQSSAGVYKVVIGRPDVDLRDMGVPVTTFSGFNTWMAFQGTPERAAVAGDFTMLAGEVEPVIRVLATAGIEVTAVHNHMVHEQPRVFFLHFWGVGRAEDLARGLKAGLDAQRR
ncbi:MAG: DUF1259 domain-containing protein [Planctomycetes bacterium]|nr:DUF1259 domain-containing protein [Planctomycetota bacterium]